MKSVQVVGFGSPYPALKHGKICSPYLQYKNVGFFLVILLAEVYHFSLKTL